MSTTTPATSCVRSTADAPIRLTLDIAPDTESQFFVDLSLDVSQAGVFAATYRDIPVGSLVTMFCAAFGEEIELHGEVVWQRDAGDDSSPGVGVRLCDLTPACRQAIERFCRIWAPLYYEIDAVAA
jgi:uncharacterized protein (TIGR02266 family)